MKRNVYCWILLIALTVTGTAASDGGSGDWPNLVILLAAYLKCLAVGWRFMELHSAHVAWKCGFIALTTAMIGLFFGLS